MSDNENTTSVKDTEHSLHECEHESSQEDLDPRIKKSLELLNDSSEKLNNATTDLTYIKNRLNQMVAKIDFLLSDYYVKHRRSIEKTRNYLKCLLALKIEADSCYIHLMEYDASMFAQEQCRTICNRLEDELITNNACEFKDLESCVENLHQLNEANEKLDYWTKRLADQEFPRNEALSKLRTVYNSCATTIKRYKSYSNPGMLYYRQQLFFYKCIYTIISYIERLDQWIVRLNENYNDLLIATNQLTFELQNKGTFEIADATSIVHQNYLEHSKHHDHYISEGRILVDKIFSIIFQMNYIYTCAETTVDSSVSARAHRQNKSFERNVLNSDSSYVSNYTKIVGSSTPPSSNCKNTHYSNTFEKSIDNNIADGIDKLHLETKFDYAVKTPIENSVTTDISLSSTTTRTSLSASVIPDDQAKYLDVSVDDSNIQPVPSERNNIVETLFGYNSIASNLLTNTRSKQFTNSLIHARTSSSSHKKTKSDFTYNKIIRNEIPSTKYLFIPSSGSVIDEEHTGDLTVCNSDVNSSKINMDLSMYNMNSSFINNIHLYIALSLDKYENLPKMPKIGSKKSVIFKSFF